MSGGQQQQQLGARSRTYRDFSPLVRVDEADEEEKAAALGYDKFEEEEDGYALAPELGGPEQQEESAPHGYDTIDELHLEQQQQQQQDEGDEPLPPRHASQLRRQVTEEDAINPALALPDRPQYQARFEELLRLPTRTARESLQRALRLEAFSREFCEAAGVLGRAIIQESVLPVPQRAFKPVSGKGVLGGEKYIAKGMFCKLSTDVSGIFGGDHGAAKAAKHEIHSLQLLVGLNEEALSFPMMAVVDYLGRRLVVTSLVDGLDDESLVYGSCDGGKSVFVSDAAMNAAMKRVGESLNLAAHNVVSHDGLARLIWGPADLEGHRTKNGRLILLDFSRLMPPEAPAAAPEGTYARGKLLLPGAPAPKRFSVRPQHFAALLGEHGLAAPGTRTVSRSQGLLRFRPKWSEPQPLNDAATQIAGEHVHGPAILITVRGRIFYQLLRPELVHSFWRVSALSSDAFSGFGCCVACHPRRRLAEDDDNKEEEDKRRVCVHGAHDHNGAVSRATREIFEKRIPQLAAALEESSVSPSDSVELVREAHRRGINVRWLGVLRARLSKNRGQRTLLVRRLLLQEMITRTVRGILAEELRTAHEHGASFRHCVSKLFNLVFGNGSAAAAFWSGALKDELTHKFVDCLHGDEEDVDMRTLVARFPLLVRLQDATGVVIERITVERLFVQGFSPKTDEVFTPEDVVELRPMTKSISLDTDKQRMLEQLLHATEPTDGQDDEHDDAKEERVAAVADDESIARLVDGGALKKRGRLFKKWHERFFVLRGQELVYFRDEGAYVSGAEPRGRVEVGGATVCVTDDEFSEPWCFVVDAEKPYARRLVLRAPDNRTRAAWLALLTRLGAKMAGAAAAVEESEVPTPEAKYYALCVRYLGRAHAHTIATALRLAVALSSSSQSSSSSGKEKAVLLIRSALEHCPVHSHLHILGLALIGELLDDVQLLERAKLFAERLHGSHPLLGRLALMIGRRQIAAGEVERGAALMLEGMRNHASFFGDSVANLLSLPLVGVSGVEASAQLAARADAPRVSGLLSVIEGLEGVPPGFWTAGSGLARRGKPGEEEKEEEKGQDGDDDVEAVGEVAAGQVAFVVPSASAPATVVRSSDGAIVAEAVLCDEPPKAFFKIVEAGEYVVAGEKRVIVRPARPVASRSFLKLHVGDAPITGKAYVAELFAHDVFGNAAAAKAGGDEAWHVALQLSDGRQGKIVDTMRFDPGTARYHMDFGVKIAGRYRLSALMDGQTLAGFPVNVDFKSPQGMGVCDAPISMMHDVSGSSEARLCRECHLRCTMGRTICPRCEGPRFACAVNENSSHGRLCGACTRRGEEAKCVMCRCKLMKHASNEHFPAILCGSCTRIGLRCLGSIAE